MTDQEAITMSRLILDGKPRSYVEGAWRLAKYVLAKELRMGSPDAHPTVQVQKLRIGNVVCKRVGDAWHVYELGPVTVFLTFEEAFRAAKNLAGIEGSDDLADYV